MNLRPGRDRLLQEDGAVLVWRGGELGFTPMQEGEEMPQRGDLTIQPDGTVVAWDPDRRNQEASRP